MHNTKTIKLLTTPELKEMQKNKMKLRFIQGGNKSVETVRNLMTDKARMLYGRVNKI